MAKFAELHIAKVYYKGNDEKFKLKPVLVIDDSEEGLCTIAEVTSEEPDKNKYFETFKIEIPEWQSIGLDKKSWVKCHPENVRRIPISRIANCIGRITSKTMINVLSKVTNQ